MTVPNHEFRDALMQLSLNYFNEDLSKDEMNEILRNIFLKWDDEDAGVINRFSPTPILDNSTVTILINPIGPTPFYIQVHKNRIPEQWMGDAK